MRARRSEGRRERGSKLPYPVTLMYNAEHCDRGVVIFVCTSRTKLECISEILLLLAGGKNMNFAGVGKVNGSR